MLSALILLAGCAPSAASYPNQSRVMPEDLADRTVALVEPNEMDGSVQAYCSGTWVRDGVIATALHCVREGGPLTYVVKSDVFPQGHMDQQRTDGHRAIVLATDEEHDLALLGTIGPIPYHKTANVTSEQLYQGELVQTMGAPLGMMFSYSHGDIAAVRYAPAVGHRPEDTMLFVQTTAPISPGNSGGALFNGAGELVGVAHASFSGRAQGINLFIHYQYVDALVRGL